MESRSRFSYKGATVVMCSINLFLSLLLLRGFLGVAPPPPLEADPEKAEVEKFIKESEEMRLAMEPVELINRLRMLEQERNTEPENLSQNDPGRNSRTAAADLSKRLHDLHTANDANGHKAVEEWLRRKIERDRARQQH
ncbi:uncharacterized protein LOC144700150 [Wolffia australiana]